MAINTHDPRPQARIRTSSGANNTEPVGPYVDRALTRRNVDNGVVAEPLPPRSGLTTLGGIRNFYAEDAAKEIDSEVPAENVGVTAPPHSGNSWKIADDAAGVPRGRDYYRNGGMHGQDYLGNQGN